MKTEELENQIIGCMCEHQDEDAKELIPFKDALEATGLLERWEEARELYQAFANTYGADNWESFIQYEKEQ